VPTLHSVTWVENSMSRISSLPVLGSIEPVISRSRLVHFHADRIAPAVSQWGRILNPASRWQHLCHFFDGTPETVRWIFTLDVLNHCFWPDPGEPTWALPYEGTFYSGYWGLAASLRRAMELGYPVTDPAYLAQISADDLTQIFSGEGLIPMFAERLQNLREAGSVILSRFGGDIISLLEDASGSAVRLVMEVVSAFPSFRDEGIFRDLKVYFWKRAQIFASDVFTAFGGKSLGNFTDIADLTAFADYKLPQVLRELGIISYTPELAARIDGLHYLEPGCEQEIEIRAMTIRAVEEIKKVFLHTGKTVTSTQVDNWLWELGQLDAFRNRPYHRCRTIFY
jgi:hypothetical protein